MFLCVLILFLLVDSTAGSVKSILNLPYKVCVTVVGNKHVQKYGADFAFLSFCGMNGVDNALIFGKPGTTHGAEFKSWHAWKNGALACLALTTFLDGLRLNREDCTVKDIFWRYVKVRIPLGWEIWQNVAYDYTRYGKMFDYRPAYNEHRVVFPSFWGDNYAPKWMNKPCIWGTIDTSLLTFGAINSFK